MHVHIVIKRSETNSLDLVEVVKFVIEAEHFRVLDRLVGRSFFPFFFFCLEDVDETHRTALAARIGHLAEKFLFVDAARSSPWRLDVKDLFFMRFVYHIAPVERNFLSDWFFKGLFGRRGCFDRFLRSFRLRKVDVRESSDFRLRSRYSGSAFAAELRTVDKHASTITTEHYYLRIVYCPHWAVLTFFARQKLCLFIIIQ